MTIVQENSRSPLSCFLDRTTVPFHFPQFKNSATLAHLAHKARGPRYVLVGGKAWYDPVDIQIWLEANKRCGPAYEKQLRFTQNQIAAVRPRKRGRPTKLEEMKRRGGLLVAGF